MFTKQYKIPDLGKEETPYFDWKESKLVSCIFFKNKSIDIATDSHCLFICWSPHHFRLRPFQRRSKDLSAHGHWATCHGRNVPWSRKNDES